MPDIRRCAIYGCKSNSRDDNKLKFFNFPSRDNPLYEIWLSICSESRESIRSQRRPYMCSKHFQEKDIGFRRLATGALPALYLKAPPGFAEEERIRLAEIEAAQAEKFRMIKLVNDAVLEWAKRAQHNPDLAQLCSTRRELRKIGAEVRDLLGATLTMHIDDYWLRKFRRSHLYQLELMDLDETRDKKLDLKSIILELDPSAVIFSEEEIEYLRKEEFAKRLQMEAKKNSAKEVLLQEKKYKNGGKNSSMSYGLDNSGKRKIKSANKTDVYDYYDPFNYNAKDESQYSEDKFERTWETNESIDLSRDDSDDCFSSDNYRMMEAPEPVIDSYQQALEHLKPLEDFALRQENYRAIGLLSTLEIIFKNPKPPVHSINDS